MSDWQFYNQIWVDREGAFHIVLYEALQPITKNEYVVYYKIEDKQKVLVLPKYLFTKSFSFHNGFSDIVEVEL